MGRAGSSPLGALAGALREVAAAAGEVNPLIAPRDLLNRWGTYRLRRHPVGTFARVAGLGAVVWVIYYCGNRWIEPRLIQAAVSLAGRGPMALGAEPILGEALIRAAGAVFSSLNIISCVAVAAIWGDLRHMARDGHMESLQVVPGRMSAPALYYGVATRYLPLALVALVIFFLDPKDSPFRRYPFDDELTFNDWMTRTNPPGWKELSPEIRLKWERQMVSMEERLMLDPWTVYWPFISIAAMLLFCIVNFFLDTAIGFWCFVRFRISIAALTTAILIVGCVTPVLFMALNSWVTRQYAPLWNTNPHNLEHMLNGLYFLYGSAASGAVGAGLLTLTALRWRRLQSGGDEDPVLLRTGH